MGEVLPKVKAKAFNELYDNNKDLMIITDSGIVIRISVDKISTMSRVTQGVKLINLKENSVVSSTAIVDKEENIEEENNE